MRREDETLTGQEDTGNNCKLMLRARRAPEGASLRSLGQLSQPVPSASGGGGGDDENGEGLGEESSLELLEARIYALDAQLSLAWSSVDSSSPEYLDVARKLTQIEQLLHHMRSLVAQRRLFPSRSAHQQDWQAPALQSGQESVNTPPDSFPRADPTTNINDQAKQHQRVTAAPDQHSSQLSRALFGSEQEGWLARPSSPLLPYQQKPAYCPRASKSNSSSCMLFANADADSYNQRAYQRADPGARRYRPALSYWPVDSSQQRGSPSLIDDPHSLQAPHTAHCKLGTFDELVRRYQHVPNGLEVVARCYGGASELREFPRSFATGESDHLRGIDRVQGSRFHQQWTGYTRIVDDDSSALHKLGQPAALRPSCEQEQMCPVAWSRADQNAAASSGLLKPYQIANGSSWRPSERFCLASSRNPASHLPSRQRLQLSASGHRFEAAGSLVDSEMVADSRQSPAIGQLNEWESIHLRRSQTFDHRGLASQSYSSQNLLTPFAIQAQSVHPPLKLIGGFERPECLQSSPNWSNRDQRLAWSHFNFSNLGWQKPRSSFDYSETRTFKARLSCESSPTENGVAGCMQSTEFGAQNRLEYASNILFGGASSALISRPQRYGQIHHLGHANQATSVRDELHRSSVSWNRGRHCCRDGRFNPMIGQCLGQPILPIQIINTSLLNITASGSTAPGPRACERPSARTVPPSDEMNGGSQVELAGGDFVRPDTFESELERFRQHDDSAFNGKPRQVFIQRRGSQLDEPTGDHRPVHSTARTGLPEYESERWANDLRPLEPELHDEQASTVEENTRVEERGGIINQSVIGIENESSEREFSRSTERRRSIVSANRPANRSLRRSKPVELGEYQPPGMSLADGGQESGGERKISASCESILNEASLERQISQSEQDRVLDGLTLEIDKLVEPNARQFLFGESEGLFWMGRRERGNRAAKSAARFALSSHADTNSIVPDRLQSPRRSLSCDDLLHLADRVDELAARVGQSWGSIGACEERWPVGQIALAADAGEQLDRLASGARDNKGTVSAEAAIASKPCQTNYEANGNEQSRASRGDDADLSNGPARQADNPTTTHTNELPSPGGPSTLGPLNNYDCSRVAPDELASGWASPLERCEGGEISADQIEPNKDLRVTAACLTSPADGARKQTLPCPTDHTEHGSTMAAVGSGELPAGLRGAEGASKIERAHDDESVRRASLVEQGVVSYDLSANFNAKLEPESLSSNRLNGTKLSSATFIDAPANQRMASRSQSDQLAGAAAVRTLVANVSDERLDFVEQIIDATDELHQLLCKSTQTSFDSRLCCHSTNHEHQSERELPSFAHLEAGGLLLESTAATPANSVGQASLPIKGDKDVANHSKANMDTQSYSLDDQELERRQLLEETGDRQLEARDCVSAGGNFENNNSCPLRASGPYDGSPDGHSERPSLFGSFTHSLLTIFQTAPSSPLDSTAQPGGGYSREARSSTSSSSPQQQRQAQANLGWFGRQQEENSCRNQTERGQVPQISRSLSSSATGLTRFFSNLSTPFGFSAVPQQQSSNPRTNTEDLNYTCSQPKCPVELHRVDEVSVESQHEPPTSVTRSAAGGGGSIESSDSRQNLVKQNDQQPSTGQEQPDDGSLRRQMRRESFRRSKLRAQQQQQQQQVSDELSEQRNGDFLLPPASKRNQACSDQTVRLQVVNRNSSFSGDSGFSEASARRLSSNCAQSTTGADLADPTQAREAPAREQKFQNKFSSILKKRVQDGLISELVQQSGPKGQQIRSCSPESPAGGRLFDTVGSSLSEYPIDGDKTFETTDSKDKIKHQESITSESSATSRQTGGSKSRTKWLAAAVSIRLGI